MMRRQSGDSRRLASVPVPSDQVTWLRVRLQVESVPTSLEERNWAQIRMAQRYSRRFNLTPLEAITAIMVAYAERFPHT